MMQGGFPELINDETDQGSVAEREGSVRLTSLY